ncbi:MAG: RNA polymerase sigma-70 factor [Reichenbachiella sp.]|uniref:RNA polymerase sigma-70 factor n=1 Tax=Reichenbachiella sp. TaxID=2184521 RepID=UPI003266705F
MHISDEDELILRLSNHDRGAFEQIFRTYYADLCKFCMKYVRDEQVAEEVVQEVFINIWERRSNLTITTSIKSYLFTAIRNRSFNYLKLQLPKEQKKVDLEGIGFLEADNREQEMIMDELRHHVHAAIEALPNKCQIIFNLSRNAGMTYKEIAEELDISVKTVENQIGLALKKLRENLNPIWDKIMLLILINIF